MALEIQDIIDIRPSEGIDALCVVTHHTDLLTLFGQLIHDGLLGEVRVLILIDKHELELLHVFPADILVIPKQHKGLHEQVVEVHRIGLTASLRVPYIYIRDLRTLLLGIITGPSTLLVLLRQHQMVLRHRDTVGHRGRLIHLVVQLHLLDDGLHQRTGITLVVDGEVRVEADLLCLGP